MGAEKNRIEREKMKRRRALILLALLALTAGAWLLFAHTAEPRYEGHPVSYWFREYCSRATGVSNESDAAVVQALMAMGTNAVPYVVRQAMEPERSLLADTPIHQLQQELHVASMPPRLLSPHEIRFLAEQALYEMKVPMDSIYVRVRRDLDGTNEERRITAFSLLRTGTKPTPALLPAFERALQSTNDWMRSSAAAVLGDMGSNALSAVPDLRLAFESEPTLTRRGLMAVAICRIDPQDAQAMTFLTNGLKGSDAARFAGWIYVAGTNARAATPALLDTIKETTNAMLISRAAWVLGKVGESPNSFLPLVRGRMASAPDPVRVGLCRAILEFIPADAEASSNLIEMARRNGGEFWIPIAGITN